ncbi:hypothetical protein Pmani_014128 [Petrolisthes manimaculis]|uniref:Uncharacterized protein n=1 Tax=Petrolisthes manimaculis TaxID=1843537 RepID=A0AAE1PX18_9EUCA|nr:hypothetical protein Pmani_014128 [Petrolisthes manimaculis]
MQRRYLNIKDQTELNNTVCRGEETQRPATTDSNAKFTTTTTTTQPPQDSVQRAKSLLGLISDVSHDAPQPNTDSYDSQVTGTRKILKTIKRDLEISNSITSKSTQSIMKQDGDNNGDNKLKMLYPSWKLTGNTEGQTVKSQQSTTSTEQELLSGTGRAEEQINGKQLFHHKGQSEATDNKESTLYRNRINHKLLINTDNHPPLNFLGEQVNDEKNDIKLVPLVSTGNKIGMKGKEGQKSSMSLYEKVAQMRNIRDSEEKDRGDGKENQESVQDSKEDQESERESVQDSKENSESVQDGKDNRESERESVQDSKENQESVQDGKENQESVQDSKENRESVQDSKENQESERQSVQDSKKRSGGGEILMNSEGNSFMENVKESIDKIIKSEQSERVMREQSESVRREVQKESVRKDDKNEEKEGKEGNRMVVDDNNNNNKAINNKEMIKKVKEVQEEMTKEKKEMIHIVDQILSNVEEEEENKKKMTTTDGKKDNSVG